MDAIAQLPPEPLMRILSVLPTLALLGLSLLPIRVAAQGDVAWAAMPADGRIIAGAGICPVRQGNQIQCLLLYCTQDRALHLSAYWIGAGTPADTVTGTLNVNGTIVLREPMTPLETAPPGIEMGIPITADTYDRIAPDLLSGGFLSFAIEDSSGGNLTIGASLAGLSPAIFGPRDLCPYAAPPPIADPVALAREEERGACASMNTQVVFDDAFVTEQDLNNDGRMDLVIDRGGASCTGMGRMNCGSAGCPQEFFVALEEGGYAQLGSGFMLGFEVEMKNIMTMYLHGSACDRVGVETCIVTYEITPDNQLVELGRN